MELFAVISSEYDVVWGMTAVMYFFMIQLAGACVLLASIGHALKLPRAESFTSLGLLAGITLGAAAPLNLVAELQQPARFASMLWRPHVTSPLSWGVFVIAGFILFSLLYGLDLLRNSAFWRREGQSRDFSADSAQNPVLARSGSTLRITAWLALLASVALFLYSGLDLAAVKSRIMWSSSMIPLVMFASALAAGTGLLGLLERITRGLNEDRTSLYRKALSYSLLLLLAAFLVWILTEFAFADQQGSIVWNHLVSHQFLQFFILAGVLGLLAPLALSLVLAHRYAVILSGFLVLAGAFSLRWVLVIGGQEIGRTIAGVNTYAPESIWSHGGLMASLGTLGLWTFLMILASWSKPWRDFVQSA